MIPWPDRQPQRILVSTIAAYWRCLVLLLCLSRGFAQEIRTNYPIDLPTALRLANARNLDVQIARSRLKEAQAARESAFEQFLPWLSPGVAYRRHQDQIQDVAGAIIDADKQSYTIGASLTAQLDI